MEMSVGGFSDFFPATGYYYFIFVFVFHYVRVLENRKIPRVLSTVASVGIDQVAELNEIRTHKITFLFNIHLPLVTSTFLFILLGTSFRQSRKSQTRRSSNAAKLDCSLSKVTPY